MAYNISSLVETPHGTFNCHRYYGWDAGCAAGDGFQTVWVNRAGDPVDRLPWKPAHILRDLTEIPKLAGV